MSDIYLKRLIRIHDDFNACKMALSYLSRHLYDSDKVDLASAVTKYQIEGSLSRLEETFIVRLFAEYEGVLKDHLLSNHPSITFNEKKIKVDWLQSAIERAEGLKIHKVLHNKFYNLRDFRNKIAHQSAANMAIIPLKDALETLAKLTNYLPDPRS